MKYYENVIFPEKCKAYIDVTKAPYFVDPTGTEDCTEKLKRIIDNLMEEIVVQMKEVYETLKQLPDNTNLGVENRKQNGRIFALFPNELNQIPAIYFPNGTYLVSDTITYSSPELHNMMFHYISGGFELNRCIRMIGQNKEKTIIKLQDHCPGFEYGQERPVVNFMLGERTNVAMSNYFENITIDVGHGNPGAVGLIFFANNSGAIRNVTIKSSDENYAGAIGLWIKHEIHSSCNAYSLTVEGFQYGILVSTYRTVSHFENITLRNQTKYGIKIENNAVQIIGLKAKANVPVLYTSGPMAHVVLADAELISDGTDYTAIKYEMGCIYLRRVTTKGFVTAFERNWFEESLPDGYVEEYCNWEGKAPFDDKAEGIGLIVPPLPDVELEQNMGNWCCVNDYGAVGDGVHDDSDAIAEAFASGKSVIWFQPGLYHITRPINIPETVKHVHFMYCNIRTGQELSQMDGEAVFHIEGNSKEMLLVEKLFTWEESTGRMRMFRHDGTRSVYMRDMHTQACAFYFNTVPGAEVFFENCACTIGKKALYGDVPCFEFNGQKAWCHSINPERSMIETINRGGTLWFSGFKTEQEGSINITTDGGTTEVLGGVAVVGHGKDNPLIYNQNSNVSAIFSTTGYHEYSTFPIAVKEERGNDVRVVRDKELPVRYAPWYFMPLYSGRAKN